ATVLEIMGRDAGTKIDTTVFRALEAYLPERRAAPAAAAASAPSALLGHPLDRGQPRFPRRGEVGEIARGGVEALGPHGVADLAAPAPGLDEPGAVEDREVLDDGGAADRQLAGERRRGAVAPLGEQRQHAPARGVRQRGEDLRRGRGGHGRAATSDRAYSARSRSSWSQPSPLPFALRSCSSAGTSSAANPLSTTRSSVPRSSHRSAIAPPGRRSISAPASPNHVPTCSGAVTSSHTRSTGAAISVSRSIRSGVMSSLQGRKIVSPSGYTSP